MTTVRLVADKIFLGGSIITSNKNQREAESVAVKDGHIIAVGSEEAVCEMVGPNTVKVDLKGNTLLPGLIEPHSHPLCCASLRQSTLDISAFSLSTPDDVFNKLKSAAATTPIGQPIVGRGLNTILMPELNDIHRSTLDNISTKHPICLMTQFLHAAYANSLALKIAGITKETPCDPTFNCPKDDDGELTGKVLGVRGVIHIGECFMKPSDGELREAVDKELVNFASYGYTTVVAMGVISNDPKKWMLLMDCVRKETCPVRVSAFLKHPQIFYSDNLSPKTKPFGEKFFVNGVKMWADGSPYAATMATKEPYLDTKLMRECINITNHPCYGTLYLTFEYMMETLLPYHEKGWQIAIHTHGERAITLALDTYESLLAYESRDDHRYRLEHFGLMTKDQLQRARQLGVTVSLYLDHVYYYGHVLRDDIIGPNRAQRFSPLASAKAAGHIWSVHSDAPCTPLGPFRIMGTALTRRIRHKNETGKQDVLGPEECVTIDDIIDSYTINAAWQIFREKEVGSIEVGKRADFVIVSKNPRSTASDDLESIQVLETLLDGGTVWKRA